jgi:hypothetical protein
MTFNCPEHGDFESGAKLRAACPSCGKTIKRFPGTESKPESEPIQEKESTEEKDTIKEEVKPPVDPPKEKKVTDPVKRIKVVTKKKQPEVIRKVVSKKPVGSKPIIKTKVRTNVEKKAAKESGESESTWQTIKRVAWF